MSMMLQAMLLLTPLLRLLLTFTILQVRLPPRLRHMSMTLLGTLKSTFVY
jgi:hypothetical protein